MITLSEAKAFLDVIHDADDGKLTMLLDGAQDEALQFMNRSRFGVDCPYVDDDGAVIDPTDPVEMPPSVKIAILLLLQAAYQASPDDAAKLRQAAEVKLQPYRCMMGV